jgi:hypothetical protein
MPASATSVSTQHLHQKRRLMQQRRSNRATRAWRSRIASPAQHALRSAVQTASARGSVLRVAAARAAPISASSRRPWREARSKRAFRRAERVRLPSVRDRQRMAPLSKGAATSSLRRWPERLVTHAVRCRPHASRTAATEVGGAIPITADATGRRKNASEGRYSCGDPWAARSVRRQHFARAELLYQR